MTDPKIISAPVKITNIPKESAGKILYDRLNSFDKNSPALLDIRSGEICTYGDLVKKSKNLAANLRKLLGIVKNDHMAIISEKSYKFWVVTLAGLYLGAPLHLLNPGYTKHELKHSLQLSQPRVVFTSKKALSNLQEVQNECGFSKTIVLDDEANSDLFLFEELVEEKSDFFNFEKINCDDQVAIIANSSGTTGLPKGVMITHANFHFNFAHTDDLEVYNVNLNTILLQIVPFYHIYGFSISYSALYKGCKILIMDQFNPKLYLQSIEKFRPNILVTVPTLGHFLGTSPLVESYDVSSVTDIFSAAGILRDDTHKKLIERFNIPSVRQTYGLTELSSASFITPIGPISKIGSCGKLTPGTSVKIVDPNTDEPLGCNEPGEIRIKACAMKGYINDPENTRSAFDDDGFIRTGDIGYFDEDRYFYIIDRLKDLIKYKSVQVPPVELEEILMKHGGIKDVAVVGKSDERYGELAVAFVVKKEGVEIGEDEIVDFLAEFVSAEKRLHGGVKFVGEIPRNGIGKILRKDLRMLL